ncbi:TPA: restriction endonuclease subunit S [Vibrio vulnificus]
MAVENLITDHIDIWTSAVKTKSTSGRGSSKKLELYGVKKLRELILELAMRGKLVPQNPNDEPASVLLDRIAEEKKKLIENKKLRKSKDLNEISEKDIPYRIPSTWKWCYLSDLGSIIGGGTPKSNEDVYWTDKGVKWLTPADLYGLKSKYIGSGKRDITNLGLEKSSAQLLPKGSVLFSSRAPIGYVAITSNELATNQGFKSVVPIFQELSEYIYYFLKRSGKFIDAEASGTTFKEVSGTVVSNVLTPLPPIAEQHRIVAKVDELMALCDQLEQQTEASIEAHQVLVTTLLDTLTNSVDADELMQTWARISEHFDTLFTTEESIDQLKQTILQLAVMGKLVPQYSNDKVQTTDLDPVVKKHRKLLSLATNTGKIDLTSFESISKKVSFPDNWAVRPLAEVVLAVVDCPHSTPKWTDNGEICVRTTQMAPFKLDLSSSRYVSSDTYIKRVERLEPTEDDVLYSREGGILGIACRVPSGTKLCLGQRMIVIRPSTFITSKFLELVLNSPLINEIARYNTTGGAAPRVNVAVIKGYPIPLPALDEQNRIIDKAEELTEICNRLKVRLKESHTIQQDLTNAMVEQAV